MRAAGPTKATDTCSTGQCFLISRSRSRSFSLCSRSIAESAPAGTANADVAEDVLIPLDCVLRTEAEVLPSVTGKMEDNTAPSFPRLGGVFSTASTALCTGFGELGEREAAVKKVGP